jgi:hypothetical protein
MTNSYEQFLDAWNSAEFVAPGLDKISMRAAPAAVK